jgi:uncharacterized lipoprotein
MRRSLAFVAAFIAIATLAACSKPPSESKTESAPAPAPAAASEVASQPLKQAYFGDLHLHTALSIDAFITGNHAG